MTFSRANPLGWALYEPLTSAQMNALDLDHSRAVDGNAGGTYNPSAAIRIGGSFGLVIEKGEVPVGGTMQVAGTINAPTGAVLELGAAVEVQYNPARPVLRTNPLIPAFVSAVSGGTYGLGGADWACSSAGGGGVNWKQKDHSGSGGNQYVQFELSPPNHGTLTRVRVGLKGMTGHGGMPGTMPSIYVLRHDYTTSIETVVAGPVVDASPDVGTYQGAHEIYTGVLAEALGPYVRFSVQITGEQGANAIDGLAVMYIITEHLETYATHANP